MSYVHTHVTVVREQLLTIVEYRSDVSWRATQSALRNSSALKWNPSWKFYVSDSFCLFFFFSFVVEVAFVSLVSRLLIVRACGGMRSRRSKKKKENGKEYSGELTCKLPRLKKIYCHEVYVFNGNSSITGSSSKTLFTIDAGKQIQQGCAI